jgi:hypothetical protein
LKIWLQQTPAERENYRRLACGVALAHAVPVKAVGGGVIDPIARYRWFRDADQAGQLLHYFRQADVRELENITGVARTDADLEWAHQNVPRSNQTMAKCGYHIHYTRFNEEGVSVQKGAPRSAPV